MTTPVHAAPRLPIHRIWWYFAAQLLAGLLVSLTWIVTGRGFGPNREPFFYFVLAVPFSQVTLLAAWSALGPGRIVFRSIGSFSFVLAAWLVGFVLPVGFREAPFNAFIPGVAMFLQWGVVQGPLWMMRRMLGWQMGAAGYEAKPGSPRDVQFGIRHLIIWTTLVAIVLGAARWFVQNVNVGHPDVTGFALFMLCNSMYAWPTLLSVLVHRWMPTAIVAALAFTIIVTWSEPYIFDAIIQGGSQENIFIGLNAIQFVWVCGSMLILRGMGYRLVRPRQPSSG